MPQRHLTPQPQRPWLIIILVLIIGVFAGIHWLKFIITLQQWDAIENAPMLVSPLYLALTGIGWGLVSIPLMWGLWVGKPWARVGVQIAGVLYFLAIWFDALWIAATDIVQTRWLFDLILSILGLSILFAATHCLASKRFFNKTSPPITP
ncbi:MAG: hypothetical protein DRI56_05895 [Chloroflexota bacterium]|nr:MAG: hypothetical protein B6243_03440 [Anaerolineaceae bacterium 4572_5.2]RLD08113.1 MAG: hypothetical protein DRI56_05895 [Chloroflexota bacterium]